MVQMIVLPLDAIDLSTLTTFWAMYESSPEVGSSQNISGGSVNTSDANDKRFISPPDKPFILPVTPMIVF